MKQFYKFIEGILTIKDQNQIVLNKDGMNIFNPNEELLSEEGWLEYFIPTPSEEEIQYVRQQKEISDSKIHLENSDYKIIKCMEAFLCGEELPYNIQELHTERNKYRNIINKYGHQSSQGC